MDVGLSNVYYRLSNVYYLLAALALIALICSHRFVYWRGYDAGNDEWRKRQPVKVEDELERLGKL
jgi:hypothetical protein